MELEDHQEASGTLESPMMGPIRQRHMLNNCGSQETNGSLLHGLLRWRGKDMFSVFFYWANMFHIACATAIVLLVTWR